MKRHIVRAGLTAAAIAGLTGCQNKPAQNLQSANALQPLTETKPPVAPVAAPAAPDIRPGTTEALTFKTQNWAREMEPLLSKRVRKTIESTDVDFLDPSDFRLGPVGMTPTTTLKKPEPPVQIVTIAHPTEDHTISLPNQGAALAVAASDTSTGVASANYSRQVTTTPNQRLTASATPPKDTATSAGDLDASLLRNLRDYPKDLWAHLDFQLLQFLKDKPTPQLDSLTPLSTEDRELISAVMDAFTNFRNAIRADNNMLMSRKVRPLLELADRVRAQADLIIPTLALCTKVDGFGVYEPVEPARFTTMKEHPIIVYCEVENFASHLNGNKMWETKLSQEVVLYTETGLPVWQDKTENIPDLARNRRHDFFVVKKTKFPANITIGRYILKVTIVDQQANRVTEATQPVLFVAQ
jgi:hypothetical protein